jgi:hypothetical protein
VQTREQLFVELCHTRRGRPRPRLHVENPGRRAARRRAGRRIRREPLQRAGLLSPREKLRHRYRGRRGRPVAALANEQKLLRIGVLQLAEQHAIDHAEHGRCGADADAEREHAGERERRRLPYVAACVPKILEEPSQRTVSAIERGSSTGSGCRGVAGVAAGPWRSGDTRSQGGVPRTCARAPGSRRLRASADGSRGCRRSRGAAL